MAVKLIFFWRNGVIFGGDKYYVFYAMFGIRKFHAKALRSKDAK